MLKYSKRALIAEVPSHWKMPVPHVTSYSMAGHFFTDNHQICLTNAQGNCPPPRKASVSVHKVLPNPLGQGSNRSRFSGLRSLGCNLLATIGLFIKWGLARHPVWNSFSKVSEDFHRRSRLHQTVISQTLNLLKKPDQCIDTAH